MKFISCTIWILALLLVAATVDNVPDPPATAPSATVCKFHQPPSGAPGVALLSGNTVPAYEARSANPAGAEAPELRCSSDPVVKAGHAADSSPPANPPAPV